MAKKKVKEIFTKKVTPEVEETPKVVEAKEEVKPVKVETPKQEVKVWTYDELVLLSRADYLKAKEDIRSGKAQLKPL